MCYSLQSFSCMFFDHTTLLFDTSHQHDDLDTGHLHKVTATVAAPTVSHRIVLTVHNSSIQHTITLYTMHGKNMFDVALYQCIVIVTYVKCLIYVALTMGQNIHRNKRSIRLSLDSCDKNRTFRAISTTPKKKKNKERRRS